ncbi:hypothetical protein NKH77_54950 [Streptomyces sp. M19]
MTHTDVDLTALPDGLGLTTTLDGTRPLAELTAAVNAVCDEVENRREKSVVVLRLAPTRRTAGSGPARSASRRSTAGSARCAALSGSRR